jgi:hypothetical protein
LVQVDSAKQILCATGIGHSHQSIWVIGIPKNRP